MKKRLMLIIAVGIAFSPSVFADSIGAYNSSKQSATAGSAFCQAGIQSAKILAEDGSRSGSDSGSGKTAGAAN